MVLRQPTAPVQPLSPGDISKDLVRRIQEAKSDLRRMRDLAAADEANIQAKIAQLEAAQAALTAEREAFIIQLQVARVL